MEIRVKNVANSLENLEYGLMDETIEETISRDDNTPSILQQAEKEGWNAGYYNFGKVDNAGTAWFNPSIIQRGEEIWMLVRGSEPHPQGFPYGQNSIWAFELDSDGKSPKRGIRLRWDYQGNVDPDQHFEDPRGFYNPNINQTIVGACTFIWYPEGRWTGAHQCIGSFDDQWMCSKMDYPRLGGGSGNLEMITDKTKYEKNWLPFLHDNRLHILYKAKPWKVFGYGQTWSEVQEFRGDGVSWAYGDVRGGTSPVLVGDKYFTFPHSSLPWRGRYRRYYAGAMCFDGKPPFTPISITPEPILRGSQNDPWAQKKPLVVFPCGAIYRDEKWLISCGVNDMKAAWVEIPHEDILKRLVPIRKASSTVFPANGLSESEQKALSGGVDTKLQDRSTNLIIPASGSQSVTPPTQKMSEERLAKLRENAAKARAARAAKRMAANSESGEPTTAFREIVAHSTRSLPKRRRKRFKRVTSEARQKALKDFEASKKACVGENP